MHQSIATIDSPEFINLRPLDINPLMSECEIKVLYVGANRNRSFMSKEVATKIGETLRGAPIVGYYKKPKEDFADHGEKLTIDDFKETITQEHMQARKVKDEQLKQRGLIIEKVQVEEKEER